MKAILQFSSTSAGLYRSIGLLRTLEKDYTITPILEPDVVDIPQILGYKVKVKSVTLDLNADLPDAGTYYFRLLLPLRQQYIALGSQLYYPSYDAEPKRNLYPKHTIELEFEIAAASYVDYITPVDLPESQTLIYSDEQDGAYGSIP